MFYTRTCLLVPVRQALCSYLSAIQVGLKAGDLRVIELITRLKSNLSNQESLPLNNTHFSENIGPYQLSARLICTTGKK
jgi:hypothetical protein